MGGTPLNMQSTDWLFLIIYFFFFSFQQQICKQVCGDCTCHCSTVIDVISVLTDTLMLLAHLLTYFLTTSLEFTLDASRKSWGCSASQPCIQFTSHGAHSSFQHKSAHCFYHDNVHVQEFQWNVEDGGLSKLGHL